MTRSLLRPLRTRRVRNSEPLLDHAKDQSPALTPDTRKTLAAIGALWVSFAVTVSKSAPARPPRLAGPTEPDVNDITCGYSSLEEAADTSRAVA